MNFNSVVINVSNLDRSIEFYRDVFGFGLMARKDQLAALNAPRNQTTQVIVLRAIAATGRIGGAGHVGIRTLVLEVATEGELDTIEAALHRRGAAERGLTDHVNWRAVVGQDPDRVTIAATCALGGGPVRERDWAALHESLYGLGD